MDTDNLSHLPPPPAPLPPPPAPLRGAALPPVRPFTAEQHYLAQAALVPVVQAQASVRVVHPKSHGVALVLALFLPFGLADIYAGRGPGMMIGILLCLFSVVLAPVAGVLMFVSIFTSWSGVTMYNRQVGTFR